MLRARNKNSKTTTKWQGQNDANLIIMLIDWSIDLLTISREKVLLWQQVLFLYFFFTQQQQQWLAKLATKKAIINRDRCKCDSQAIEINLVSLCHLFLLRQQRKVMTDKYIGVHRSKWWFTKNEKQTIILSKRKFASLSKAWQKRITVTEWEVRKTELLNRRIYFKTNRDPSCFKNWVWKTTWNIIVNKINGKWGLSCPKSSKINE